MQVLAFYLPQFHRVSENDRWWGNGYTEWTAVRSAEPLFSGHEEPRVPLHGNYYNLLDKKTMEEQARLMHEYGIDGMCFYHYYFKDGRKILEKPAENLLRWKDIDMPFCFSWANESWVRSWSKLTDNSAVWNSKFEEKYEASNSSDDGVLLRQEYGDCKDWEKHYRYLSSFFRDDRYIKKDGCPLLVIYMPKSIPCLKDMMEFWQELARKDGFNGLYLVGVKYDESPMSEQEKGLSNVLYQQPQYIFDQFFPEVYQNKDHVMRSIPYRDLWQILSSLDMPDGASLCGVVGYDDTPRRGRGGTVVKNRNPFIFYDGMKKTFQKAIENHAPFVFVNAWNEWGEGMYLEPDERFGTRFLEAFRAAKEDAEAQKEKSDTTSIQQSNFDIRQIQLKDLQEKCYKYRGYWKTMQQLLDLWESKKKNVAAYFSDRHWNRIALYGYGMLGKHFTELMKRENIQLSYAVDQQGGRSPDFLVYIPNDKLPQCDVMIITVLYDYDGIRDNLRRLGISCEFIPLDILLSDMIAYSKM